MAAHLYWRVKFTDYVGGGAEVALSVPEVQLRASIGGADECVGGTATYDSTADGDHQSGSVGQDPAMAFDDDGSTVFITDSFELPTSGDPIYLRYAFAAPVDIVEMAVQGVADGATNPINFADAPKAWVLQYSDDDSTYTDVYTVSGQTGWAAGELRTFSGWAPAELEADITDADDTLAASIGYHEDLSDSIHVQWREKFAINATMLRDALLFGDTPVAQLIVNLVERIILTGTPSPSAGIRVSASDTITFADTLQVVWALLISEEVQFTGAAAGNRRVVASIIDYVHAVGLATNKLGAKEAVVTAIAMSDLLHNGWRVDQVDTIDFQDALAAKLGHVVSLVQGISFADTATPQVRLLALVQDSLQLDDTLSSHLAASETLRDQVLFYVSMRLGASEFSGWVLNQGGALSEYTNYPFNGFVEFPPGSKRYLGTSDQGLYLLEGTDDDGEAIVPKIRTAIVQFAEGLATNLPDVYMANTSAGDFILKVLVTDVDGEQHEHHYRASVPAGTAKAGRFKPGRGLSPASWQFELEPVEGSTLDLLSLKFRPVLLDSGRI
jgi:hypothetical protein